MILYILFSCKLLVTRITSDSLDSFSFLQKLHRGTMTCDACELFIWLFRLKHHCELKRHLTHTQKIHHANNLCGSLNYSSVTKGSTFNTLIEKIIELSRCFISAAGFNLIQTFLEAGIDPENTKLNLQTSKTYFFGMFHQSCRLYAQSHCSKRFQ